VRPRSSYGGTDCRARAGNSGIASRPRASLWAWRPALRPFNGQGVSRQVGLMGIGIPAKAPQWAWESGSAGEDAHYDEAAPQA